MARIDRTFNGLCRHIMNNGRRYENKNRAVERIQIPSFTLRHDFVNGFPAITMKHLPFKMIVTELLWFLKGDNDVEYLNENGCKIWNKDAYNWYKKEFEQMKDLTGEAMLTFEEFSKIGKGSVGQNYSVQWRNFNGKTDQIQELIDNMEKDIMSSRLKVNAWNPSETEETALPPCHSEFQIIGVPLTIEERCRIAGELMSETALNDLGIPEFGFELHWNQGSVDTFLGLPFNSASYGLLAKILEAITGYPALAIEGALKCVHFYDNSYDAVDEMLTRDWELYGNCEVKIPEIPRSGLFDDQCIDEYLTWLSPNNIELVGYKSHPPLKVDMLAPKE